MIIDVIRNHAMKISILRTECKYFTKNIFLCKLFPIKFPKLTLLILQTI